MSSIKATTNRFTTPSIYAQLNVAISAHRHMPWELAFLTILQRARPARSVLDFSLCFQHSCLFFCVFLFLYFTFVLIFSLFISSSSFFFFLFFYFSFCCLSSRFLPLGTHMASRQIHRTPKVVLFSFFSSL